MTEPTDDELDAVIAEYRTRIYPQDMHPRFERAIMRAAIAKWGTPPPKWEPVAWNGLTDEDRERAMNSMPGMLEGFTKTWGWLHFAKAIEAICREKNARPAPASRLEIESMRGRSVPVSEADMVLAAMETGEWELQRLLPQTCFTSEANIRNAWSVKRSAAPYCTKDGLRIWTGATPLEALCNGAAALGVELPGCSETAALPKTVVAILGEQAELRRLSECCPELNLSNYGHDDVDELNGWAIEVSQCIDRALAAQPAGAQQPIGSNNGFTAPQTESQPVPVPRWDEMIRQQFPDMPPKGWSDTLIRRYMTRELDAYRAARAPADSGAAPSQQVIVDFAQVGTAGPFAVVDGRVSLPDATMQDLVHMLRPTFNAQAADSVLEDAARAGFFLQLPQRPKPEAPAGTVGLDWDAYSGAQMLAYGRDCSNAAIVAAQKPGGL